MGVLEGIVSNSTMQILSEHIPRHGAEVLYSKYEGKAESSALIGSTVIISASMDIYFVRQSLGHDLF